MVLTVIAPPVLHGKVVNKIPVNFRRPTGKGMIDSAACIGEGCSLSNAHCACVAKDTAVFENPSVDVRHSGIAKRAGIDGGGSEASRSRGLVIRPSCSHRKRAGVRHASLVGEGPSRNVRRAGIGKGTSVTRAAGEHGSRKALLAILTGCFDRYRTRVPHLTASDLKPRIDLGRAGGRLVITRRSSLRNKWVNDEITSSDVYAPRITKW